MDEVAAADECETPGRAPALDAAQVHKAAGALLKYIAERKAHSRNLLEDEAEWIYLFVRYQKTPTFFSKFPIQLELPTPIWNAEEFRICLVMCDKKNGKRVAKATELLVPDHVAEVMSASEMRRQYHDAELKRELCKSYDLFLLENVLSDFSSDLFGGRFVEMKKFPSLVKLTKRSEKWIEAINEVKAKTQMSCYVHHERSIRVGRSCFPANALTENMLSVVAQMMERPEDGGWNQVLQMYLCTGQSLRLPIYQTLPNPPPQSLPDVSIKAEADASQKKRKRVTSKQTAELKKRLVAVFNAHQSDTALE